MKKVFNHLKQSSRTRNLTDSPLFIIYEVAAIVEIFI